jgi:PKD domain
MNAFVLAFLITVKLFFPHQSFTGEPVAKANYAFQTTPAGGLLVTLDGSGSKDPDGYIAKYEWTQVGNNPNTVHIAYPNVAVTTAAPGHWVLGIYKFQLKVTDNNGASSVTTVTVTVVNGTSS